MTTTRPPRPPLPPDLREALGLPPRPLRASSAPLLVAAALAVLVLAGLAGWLAGTFRHSYRLRAFCEAAFALQREQRPGRVQEALTALEAERMPLVLDPLARWAMSLAYVKAAQIFPNARPYVQQAREEIQAAGELLGPATAARIAWQIEDTRAQVLMELGRDQDARQAFRALEQILSESPDQVDPHARLTYDNNLAYLLASSQDPQVRDPETALRLAKKVVSSTLVLDAESTRLPSQEPAYLDTLAEAYHASGDSRQAIFIQRRALAGADTAGLDVYLRHFDAYHATDGGSEK